MYLPSGTVWIFSLSQDSFPSTSMIPLSTDLAAIISITRYRRAISAVWFICAVAEIVPFAFLFKVMIRTCAGACCWNSTLWTADAISSCNFWGRGILASLHEISRLSARLKLAVRAGPGSGTISPLFTISCLFALLNPPRPMGGLWLWVQGGVDFRFGLGSCCNFGCTLSGSLGFSYCCSSWCFSGPAFCIVSASCEASSPPPSITAVMSLSFSLASWPRPTPCMMLGIMLVIPIPHSLSSSWRATHFCFLFCIHLIIPNH